MAVDYEFSPGKIGCRHQNDGVCAACSKAVVFEAKEAPKDDKDKQIAALKASLIDAYNLVYDFWNESVGDGVDAKELRRSIWFKCLKPHEIEHPKGWFG